MTYLAFGICLFIAALGVLGIISPARLHASIRRIQTPGGLYAAAALRFVLGVALIVVAPASKAPELLRIIGGLTVAGALITLVVGLARWERIVEWWFGHGSLVIRVWAVIPLALGLYVAWAVLP